MDGSKFEGEYINGLKQGEGVFKFKDGNVYEGHFVENMIEGLGNYTW
jgi:hypothetical protein